jgi:hypothetical protein
VSHRQANRIATLVIDWLTSKTIQVFRNVDETSHRDRRVCKGLLSNVTRLLEAGNHGDSLRTALHQGFIP